MKTNTKQVVKTSRKTFEKIGALILAIILLCAGTAFATSPSEYAVDIYDGTQITRVETNKQDPYKILEQGEIVLGKKDKLDVSGFTAGTDSVLKIYRAVHVAFTDIDGKTVQTMCAGHVSDLLQELKIEVSENEILNVNPDDMLTDGLTVKRMNTRTVYVTADAQTQELKVGNITVQEALQQAGVVLGEQDEVSPALQEAVQDQMTISVYRVTYAQRTATESIPYKTQTKKNSALLVGKTNVLQEGKNGQKKVTYKDKYVDGKLDSSAVLTEEVLQPATTKIVEKGTKKKTLSASKLKNGGNPISELTPPSDLKIVNGAPTSYSKIIRGKAAAYSAKPSAKTASGRRVKPGYVAVNPNQIPYGTEMWIVSTEGYVYGYAIAADTGGFIHQGKFTVDLFMSTTAECRQWGARDVLIYVL